MGDITAEPSMEEILSSIKRIIAEEGEGTPQRPRRPQRVPAPLERQPEGDGVLELREPMPLADRADPQPSPPPSFQPPESAPAAQPVARPAEPRSEPQPARVPEPSRVDPIVSQQAAAASRGSLEALSRLVVRPDGAQPAGDNTLEGLVRDMLRPMLREWLDAHLPEIVEAMVAREIERITGTR